MKKLRSLVCGGLALAASISLVAAPATSRESILYSFFGAKDGGNPTGLLSIDRAGNLYGATAFGGNPSCVTDVNSTNGCGVVFEVTASGSESVLHTFTGGSDGGSPVGGVIRDAAGTLYGATAQGGVSGAGGYCSRGCGTVFALTTAGKLNILHAFTGGSDGLGPSFGLLAGGARDLYGMTLSGGSSDTCGDRDTPGCGTVFKVSLNGRETVLHAFTGGSNDGAYPLGSLIADSTGNLYGTTVAGGSTDGCGILLGEGCGIVFKLASDGKLSILHAFTGGNGTGSSDGAYPTGALLFDSSGNLYGTTVGGGGTANCGIGAYGCGTIFKLAPNGDESVLYAFKGGSDGGYPTAGVVEDNASNFYGVTAAGGSNGKCGAKIKLIGCGVVFELPSAGSERVLSVFTGRRGAGGYPVFGIVRTSARDFSGATMAGGMRGCNNGAGTLGCGTVFALPR